MYGVRAIFHAIKSVNLTGEENEMQIYNRRLGAININVERKVFTPGAHKFQKVQRIAETESTPIEVNSDVNK